MSNLAIDKAQKMAEDWFDDFFSDQFRQYCLNYSAHGSSPIFDPKTNNLYNLTQRINSRFKKLKMGLPLRFKFDLFDPWAWFGIENGKLLTSSQIADSLLDYFKPIMQIALPALAVSRISCLDLSSLDTLPTLIGVRYVRYIGKNSNPNLAFFKCQIKSANLDTYHGQPRLVITNDNLDIEQINYISFKYNYVANIDNTDEMFYLTDQFDKFDKDKMTLLRCDKPLDFVENGNGIADNSKMHCLSRFYDEYLRFINSNLPLACGLTDPQTSFWSAKILSEINASQAGQVPTYSDLLSRVNDSRLDILLSTWPRLKKINNVVKLARLNMMELASLQALPVKLTDQETVLVVKWYKQYRMTSLLDGASNYADIYYAFLMDKSGYGHTEQDIVTYNRVLTILKSYEIVYGKRVSLVSDGYFKNMARFDDFCCSFAKKLTMLEYAPKDLEDITLSDNWDKLKQRLAGRSYIRLLSTCALIDCTFGEHGLDNLVNIPTIYKKQDTYLCFMFLRAAKYYFVLIKHSTFNNTDAYQIKHVYDCNGNELTMYRTKYNQMVLDKIRKIVG